MLRVTIILALFATTFVFGQSAADTLAGSGAGTEAFRHNFVLFLHELLLVYWLGPDVAVFIWSQRVVNPELTPEARITAARMMAVIDLVPRACLALFLTVAGILTETYGIEHPWWQMAGIVLLGPVWLFLVLAAWLRDGTGFGRTMEKLDVWLRMLLVLGIPASVAYASATERLQDTPWIAGKLMILAAVILFGLIMRLRFQGFFAGAASLVADGPSADVDRRMSASLRRARPFWLAIWLLLLAAALMGVVKPGDVESVPAAAVAKYPSDSRVTDPSVATRIVLAP